MKNKNRIWFLLVCFFLVCSAREIQGQNYEELTVVLDLVFQETQVRSLLDQNIGQTYIYGEWIEGSNEVIVDLNLLEFGNKSLVKTMDGLMIWAIARREHIPLFLMFEKLDFDNKKFRATFHGTSYQEDEHICYFKIDVIAEKYTFGWDLIDVNIEKCIFIRPQKLTYPKLSYKTISRLKEEFAKRDSTSN